MLFTTRQIDKITSKVDLYHLIYVCDNVGTEVLTRSDKRLLSLNKIDLSKYEGKTTPLTYAYSFGKMESSIRDPKSLLKLNLAKYKEFYKTNPEVFKMNRQDKINLKTAKQQLYNDIMRAAGDIKSDLHQSLIEASKTTVDIPSAKRRASVALQTVSKALSGSTKKYANRFKMISGYNMHSAYQTGIAAELLERKGNTKVYFSVHPDACPHCKRTYLRADGKPKVFYLKAVINNGSNIGRKAKDYKPSIQPLHPHCRCKLNLYPGDGAIWSVGQGRYIKNFKKSLVWLN